MADARLNFLDTYDNKAIMATGSWVGYQASETRWQSHRTSEIAANKG